LAAWLTNLLRPAQLRLERLLRGKGRAAATLVFLLVFGVLLPLTGVALLVAPGVQQLIEGMRDVLEGHGSLGGMLLSPRDESADLAALATRYGENVWHTLTAVVRASATAAISVLVFIAALYTFLADGERAHAWLADHAPISRESFERLASAFAETGRGLLIAGGGTALVQAAVATVTYVALGIPHAFLLGPLTGLCAVVPAIGTAVVWVPLAIELAVSGAYVSTACMVGAGLVISVVDNVVRPALARHGRLALPTFAVLVSMLGGVAVFGPTGALLGPLVVRLAVEALAIVSEAEPSSP
jgi:predicted PurR-regulated permease PerM